MTPRARRPLLLVLVLAVFFGIVPPADGAATESFWETDFGVVHLEETGGVVLGSYQCCGGILEGTVAGSRYDLRWQDATYGAGWVHFERVGSTLRGSWGTTPGTPLGTWNGTPLRQRPRAAGDTEWRMKSSAAGLAVEGVGRLRFAGSRVTGVLAGTASLAAATGGSEMEVFNDLQGLRAGRELTLSWSNPLQGRSGTMRLLASTGACWSGDWRASDGSVGQISLCPATSVAPARLDLAAAAARDASRIEGRRLIENAMQAYRAGQYSAAVAAAARATGKLERSGAGSSDLLANGYLVQAHALRRLGKEAEARALFSKVLTLRGIDPDLTALAQAASGASK
ncbi:MAG TPA: hypothetical protein VHQ65_09330 [Thermoanaerobaculia bacterium]|nr:hypothetical protein [Thermoanaerobaculia bacterium]